MKVKNSIISCCIFLAVFVLSSCADKTPEIIPEGYGRVAINFDVGYSLAVYGKTVTEWRKIENNVPGAAIFFGATEERVKKGVLPKMLKGKSEFVSKTLVAGTYYLDAMYYAVGKEGELHTSFENQADGFSGWNDAAGAHRFLSFTVTPGDSLRLPLVAVIPMNSEGGMTFMLMPVADKNTNAEYTFGTDIKDVQKK